MHVFYKYIVPGLEIVVGFRWYKGSRKLYRVGTNINQFVMRIKLDLFLQSIAIVFLIGLLTLTVYNSYVYGSSNDELVITTR